MCMCDGCDGGVCDVCACSYSSNTRFGIAFDFYDPLPIRKKSEYISVYVYEDVDVDVYEDVLRLCMCWQLLFLLKGEGRGN